ncbi:unnamed protein product [Moneuplotes crassus]|uniref:Uncharacterized protein n=1 Tax=Euplotes crassus TaxID=5936 RepID=A0AAD1X815_EUPCR|nr:unnamed protein product [Moneuplotes crassus]
MEVVNATRKKFQCSDPACKKDRVYFCKSHQMKACRSCASKMHFKCQLNIIHDLTDLNVDVIEAKRFVKRLFELIAENGLRAYSPNIDGELKEFQDSLVETEKKIRDAITHNHYEQFDTLQSQIKQIQIQMSDSNVVKDIFYFSALRDVSLYSLPKIGKVLSSATKVKEKIDAVVKENVDLMEKKFHSKSRQFEEQCKASLTEEFKDEIQNLKDLNDAKDTELEEQKEATEQARQDTEDTKKQRDEISAERESLQNENKDLKDFKAQLEEDLKAKVDQIEESKSQHAKDQEEMAKVFEELKERESALEETKEIIKGLYKNICPDFNPESKELELNMSEDKSKDLVKSIGASKYSLGDMNRLQIDKISNEDHTLNNFLKNCSPSSLRLLSFNHSYLEPDGIAVVKVKFYEEGMQKLLTNVTKEVYLEHLIVDASDLSQIVKACVNSERLTIRCSQISTSDSLDFSTPAQTKLQYLSFYNCGGSAWCNQEWDKYPSRFEKIIVAIKNSSLKNSLNTINVECCKISVSKVNELLAAHDLSHISVGEECNEPLTE